MLCSSSLEDASCSQILGSVLDEHLHSSILYLPAFFRNAVYNKEPRGRMHLVMGSLPTTLNAG